MKRITFSLSIILFGIILFQKAAAQENQSNAPAVLNHIAVYVSELQKSTTFYENLFNLKVIPEPFKDGKHTWFSLGGTANLHLIQGAKPNQNYDKNEHLCFSVSSISNFIEKLKLKKINFENWLGAPEQYTLRVDGVKQIYFKDPDGHWLEVNDAK